MPTPPSNAAFAWGLTAYPVSAPYRALVQDRLSLPLEVVVLSEMRSAGIAGVVKRLIGVRAPLGVVLSEDSSSRPLLPVLRFLLSLTRCRRLVTADAEGRVASFSRLTGWSDSLRLLSGSVRGVAAAARCAMELAWLERQPPLRAAVRPLTRAAYLKTNLWFGIKAGGSVGHVAGVANALARRCTVDLLAVEEPPLLEDRVRYHAIPHAGTFGHPYELNYFRYQSVIGRRAREVFGRSPADVVYQRLSISNYSGVRLARDLRVPLILEYNGSEVWVAKHWGRPLTFPRLATSAEHVSLHHADLIVTVSDVLRQELLERGIPDERILVHPNCVDPARFDPALFTAESRAALLGRYGIPPTATVCGFIGTFGAWHGVIVLAEVVRQLCEAAPAWLHDRDVRFLLVGDGLLMPRVREILAAPAAEARTVLTGLVPQHEAALYLAASDVLLSPHVPNADGSAFFGSPTKLFEYMAMERGIVASDLDQIGDVLRRSYRATHLPGGPAAEDDDRVAVLVDPGSRDELIAAVRFLVERPDYRRVLGRNARAEVLRHYTWDRNVEALLSRLQALRQGP